MEIPRNENRKKNPHAHGFFSIQKYYGHAACMGTLQSICMGGGVGDVYSMVIIWFCTTFFFVTRHYCPKLCMRKWRTAPPTFFDTEKERRTAETIFHQVSAQFVELKIIFRPYFVQIRWNSFEFCKRNVEKRSGAWIQSSTIFPFFSRVLLSR